MKKAIATRRPKYLEKTKIPKFNYKKIEMVLGFFSENQEGPNCEKSQSYNWVTSILYFNCKINIIWHDKNILDVVTLLNKILRNIFTKFSEFQAWSGGIGH